MRGKFLKRITAIICIIALVLPISSEVLAKITSTAKGSEQEFGIKHIHSSNYLNGSGTKNFGYKVDDRLVYRIYSGSESDDGYNPTVVCLDEKGKFPAEDRTANKYTSLGEATSEVLQTIQTNKGGTKTNLTAEDAKRIIWLMNNAVLPEDSDELKEVKLSKILAGPIESTAKTRNPLTIDYVKSVLTEDDLVFALQATIWSITNGLTNPVYQGATSDRRTI